MYGVGIPLVLIVLLAGGFLVMVMMQPDEMSVARSTTIDAPPGIVFQQVNDFRNWKKWSPWEKRDPDMKIEYKGEETGEGAVYTWDSKSDEVGAGQMTITQSTPNEQIKIALEFERPFEDTANPVFDFAPEGDGTKVTWSMAGKNNFMSKVFMVFMDFEKIIGDDFEAGLASMKTAAEDSKAAADAPPADAPPADAPPADAPPADAPPAEKP